MATTRMGKAALWRQWALVSGAGLTLIGCGRLDYGAFARDGSAPDAPVEQTLTDVMGPLRDTAYEVATPDGMPHDGSLAEGGVGPSPDGGSDAAMGSTDVCPNVVAVIELDGFANCSTCANNSPSPQAKMLLLPAGSYRLVPVSGAVSWLSGNAQPWSWRICLKIPDTNQSPIFEIDDFASAAQAFQAAQAAAFHVTAATSSMVYFSFADVGCGDNVGGLRFAVCPMAP